MTIAPVLPTYNRAAVSFERGAGARAYTAEGVEYLDFGAGVAVNSCGHAHPHLVQALQINPNSADAHYLMGTILEDERNFDRAKESYAQVLRIRPGHAEAADRLRRLPNPL